MENRGFDFDFVMAGITLDQAIEEGLMVPIFANRWPQLSGGKPIIATQAILAEFSLAAMREVWNEYVVWRQDVMPTLPRRGATVLDDHERKDDLVNRRHHRLHHPLSCGLLRIRRPTRSCGIGTMIAWIGAQTKRHLRKHGGNR